MALLIRDQVERRTLGRFYLAAFLPELAHLSMPFQVLLVALYLGKVEVGILIGIERAIAIVFEIPTGVWSDRYGRKRCVVIGHFAGILAWLLTPAATFLPAGPSRFTGFAFAFALHGLGHALLSGAFEAWVVDNLLAQGLRRLTINYFSRERAFASAGGLCAGGMALILAARTDIRWFWPVTAIGEMIAVLLLLPVPELVPPEDEEEDEEEEDEEEDDEEDEEDEEEEREQEDKPEAEFPTSWTALKLGLSVIRARPALLGYTLMFLWMATALDSRGEAFHLGIFDAHASNRFFAGVEIGVDLIGVIAPLVAIPLARRFASRALLAAMIVLPALATLAIWNADSAILIAGMFLLTMFAADIFHPIAEDYHHRLIPSSTRAVTASTINLIDSIASLVSAGLLAFLATRFAGARIAALFGLLALPSVLLLFLFPGAGQGQKRQTRTR